MPVIQNIDADTPIRPAVISGREPMRSARRPAIGPETITHSVVGRKRSPVCSGVKPRTSCMYSASEKNVANITKETMKATTLAPKKARERKKPNSTIGARRRGSMATKAASARSATPNNASTRAEPQPQALLLTSASTSAASPTVSVATPGTSTSRVAVSSRDSCTANSVTTIASAATGTLSKKIDCQLTSWTRKPPSTGPIASAIAETPAHVPIARPRSCAGNALVMIDRVPGIMKPEPTPCRARNAISQLSLCESAIMKLEKANTLTPRRPPVTSSTANVSVYAWTVHSSEEVVACRLRWIDGSATFTTVLSSMIMNSAKHIAPSAHQRRLPSFILARMRSVIACVPSHPACRPRSRDGARASVPAPSAATRPPHRRASR